MYFDTLLRAIEELNVPVPEDIIDKIKNYDKGVGFELGEYLAKEYNGATDEKKKHMENFKILREFISSLAIINNSYRDPESLIDLVKRIFQGINKEGKLIPIWRALKSVYFSDFRMSSKLNEAIAAILHSSEAPNTIINFHIIELSDDYRKLEEGEKKGFLKAGHSCKSFYNSILYLGSIRVPPAANEKEIILFQDKVKFVQDIEEKVRETKLNPPNNPCVYIFLITKRQGNKFPTIDSSTFFNNGDLDLDRKVA